MKFPEKNTIININRYPNTATIVGCILMISHILGYLSGWLWTPVYITILIIGHIKENTNDRSNDRS